ncbi:hypothetical protein K504DRAFT_464840 [Pleomassaria siparia CBS 279.74]|uniref:Protein sip5 n=1 Tax=Pleomassaria siparia CBS 279.74 TaxID=1314801 RepID=A0A6G1KK86_9PLEO|nr:hypothetical protein K504DRAFT_464840 [Pleomassaria siparia CBS 279.74]
MGNNQAKESRPDSSRGHTRQMSGHNPNSPITSGPPGPAHHERSGSSGVYNVRTGRGARHDISFLGIGSGANTERDPALEPRRETKAEREARKLEKDRAQRALDRERSLREEGVDGGFLVTLGTYTGPEDFNKSVVRQLQIERRMAPFWKGLNDHEDTWVEHQLVAVVNDLPLPAPDAIPSEEPPRSNRLGADWNPGSSNSNLNHLTVPISSRSMSQNSERSTNLTPSHPAFSLPSPTSPIAASPSSSPFFRGRAKTLAALTTGSRNNSQTDMTPQEVELPKDPYVNGQRIEAFLYKNASECPICFLYYPPYLNKTRCCDQPICSECFVQIKRPDPHPPEHHDPSNSTAPPEPQEDGALVSEPASCPFCVQPEFGVTYEPPPFRRGLSYANQSHSLAHAQSAMSSTSSLNSQGPNSPGRRRATLLAVDDNTVITTDRVRPDWAKKLADARSHALRRAAAATALHNAAYMMGNMPADSRGFGLGRRRRAMFGAESGGSSGNGTPRRDGDVGALLAAAITGGSSSRTEGSSDLISGRQSSRRGNRLEDLEELMMMEAIRLSLAAEEDRKKKEEKEAAKEAKKEDKKKAKESKRSERTMRKIGIQPGFHPAPNMDGEEFNSASSSTANTGKGKAVDRSGGSVGFNPLSEPTSTVNASSSKDPHQRHLEESRAHIQREPLEPSTSPSPYDPFADPPSHRAALRNLSNPSSSASSFAESLSGSLHQDYPGGFGVSSSSFDPSPNESGLSLDHNDTPPQGASATESMFNFSSLAAVITNEKGSGDHDGAPQHIENVAEGKQQTSESSRRSEEHVTNAENLDHSTPDVAIQPPGYTQTNASKHAEYPETLGESVTTLRPDNRTAEDVDEIGIAPRVEVLSNNHSNHLDSKHIGDVGMADSCGHQHTL